MFALTQQERRVVYLSVLIVFLGTVFQYAFKKYPSLRDSVNLLDSAHVYSKVDLNKASLSELVEVPYIGEYTAANIIEYRLERGWFNAIEQVKEVKGIREKNYERFYRYLKIDGGDGL